MVLAENRLVQYSCLIQNCDWKFTTFPKRHVSVLVNLHKPLFSRNSMATARLPSQKTTAEAHIYSTVTPAEAEVPCWIFWLNEKLCDFTRFGAHHTLGHSPSGMHWTTRWMSVTCGS